MTPRFAFKIALIGTSGAGKSVCCACLNELGTAAADMDDRLHGLDTSTPQTADAMLDWIARSRSSVVAVSVHREGLKEIASLKCTSSHEGIDQIRFVYLFCEKDALEKRLRQHGSGRKPDNIEGTLADYDEMDRILREVMDESIDTTQLSMLDVAAKVRMLLCADGAASDGAGE